MTDVVITTVNGTLTVNTPPAPQSLSSSSTPQSVATTPAPAAVSTTTPATVTASATAPQQLQVGTVGPQGPAGSTAITRTAAESINTGAVVSSSASGLVNASADNLTKASAVVGVTTNSGLVGSPIQFMPDGGLVVNPSFNFTPGPVYLGLNGAPTQAPPTGAGIVLRQIGVALDSQTLGVQLGPVIQRG